MRNEKEGKNNCQTFIDSGDKKGMVFDFEEEALLIQRILAKTF